MPLPDRLSRSEIATVLGVTERSITNYQKLPKPIPTSRHQRHVTYPLVPCVAWFVDYRIQESASAKGMSELDMAKQRREIAAARKMELEVAALEGSMMPTELHDKRLRERCDELAGRVKGLNRYIGKIRSTQTEEEADLLAEQMEDELLAALRETADAIPDDDPEDHGDDATLAA